MSWYERQKLGLESDTKETINPAAAVTAGACNMNYKEKLVGECLILGLRGQRDMEGDGRRHYTPSYTPYSYNLWIYIILKMPLTTPRTSQKEM